MSVPPLTNNFEGGVNGNNIATSDTGSGNAWDAVVNSTGTLKYSNTQARGLLSCQMITAASFAEVRVDWTGLGSLTTNIWGRQYLYVPAIPSSNWNFCLQRTNSGVGSAGLRINSAGVVVGINAAGSVISTGTSVIATNRWIRIEWRILSSTTVGELEWWLYNDADSGIVTDTELANGLVLGANTDWLRLGMPSAAPGSFTAYMDDIAVSTAGKIGPTVPPSVSNPDFSNFPKYVLRR